jgi:tRNA G10  N-methylase Trm11
MSMEGQKLYEIHHADAFGWLATRQANSVHAVVTDPPFGLIEYTAAELAKRSSGKGGVWRQPPSLGGHRRQPVPRFTVLSSHDRRQINSFFRRLGSQLARVLVPGAHVFITTTQLVSHHAAYALESVGLEKRGVIVRVVKTLRGGDRPKAAG